MSRARAATGLTCEPTGRMNIDPIAVGEHPLPIGGGAVDHEHALQRSAMLLGETTGPFHLVNGERPGQEGQVVVRGKQHRALELELELVLGNGELELGADQEGAAYRRSQVLSSPGRARRRLQTREEEEPHVQGQGRSRS